MTPALRVVMAQLNLRVGDIDGNVQRIIEVAAQARQQQADLLVLPELSLCGYPPEDLLLRASMQRRIEAALQRFCSVLHTGLERSPQVLTVRGPQGCNALFKPVRSGLRET